MTDAAGPATGGPAPVRSGAFARLLRLFALACPRLSADQADIMAKVKFPCC